ncbi:MAG: PKD domain-containing protein [Williamsia sp.]|nr:PKD domain-containing protein [Williamsia sp.]
MKPKGYLSICLLLYVVVPVVEVGAQTTAAFRSDTIRGCAPLVIRFSDQSAGNPVYWRWELGNGTISFNQNPSTTYFNAGQYTVKLFVRNAAGETDSVTKTQYITAYAPPLVSFKASDTTGCFPLNVQFTDLSTPGSGSITNWEWDFGDGFTSSEANPVHSYTALGNYNVSLRTTNSNGCITTLSKQEYVRVTSGVLAGFSFTAPNSCRPPTSISFTNFSTGTGTLAYSWSFGDGGIATSANPSHSYNNAGTYTVRLIVQNNAGCRDTMEKANAITIGTVTAGFSSPVRVCAGVPVPLTNTSAPAPSGALWSFGDGSTSTALTPAKTYAAPGNYTIKLVSDFGACKDSISKAITVLPKPAADFSAPNAASCRPPLTVSFTNGSTGVVSYRWLFGDGSSSTEQQPAHTYQQSGEYNVTLVVTGQNGCTDSIIKQGFVKITPARVEVKDLPQQGCAPLTFTPSTLVNSVEPITGYQWDFGDGTNSGDAQPTHVYTNPGVYTLKLFFTTRSGCRDSVVYTDQIRVGVPPVVNFSATPATTCAFQPVKFTDQTTGNALAEWYWEFGDGSVFTGQNPAHIYSDTGRFTVTLTVSNNGCKAALKIPDYINIRPPIAIFRDSAGCTNPFARKFIDRSIGATGWTWDFGDGTSSTEQNPLHTYAKSGSYVVKLTVRNDSCENTANRQVQIVAEKADFTATDTIACKGANVVFQTRNMDQANISQQIWLFGDGFYAGGTTPVSHRYTSNGKFSVQLFIRDINGCTDTLTKQQYIRITGPTANFNAPVKTGCLNSTIVFTDLSVPDENGAIREWRWKWGDGSGEVLTAAPFQHTYAAAGNFPVQLAVTDQNGCTDSIAKTGSVLISRPTAAFTSPDSLSCYNKPIRFINQSVGTGLSSVWDFGDNASPSILSQPVHSYPDEGSYSIKLVVKDQYGCLDSTSRPQYIRIRNPRAAFTVNDSVATCPPLVTTFKNTSQNFVGYSWNFGDGTRSAVDNPTHFYNSSGTFIAKLVITSAGGCMDSTTKTMVVRGPQGDFTYLKTTGCTPVSMQFRASTKDKVSFLWDFNDGSTESSLDSSTSHTYTIPGSYIPKIILIDPQGCKVPVVGKDTIHVLGVTANFTASQLTVCDSGQVQFRNASVSNDTISTYLWNLGDGSFSTQPNPVHFYRREGRYPVSLAVTTRFGCTDTIAKATALAVVRSPVIDIQGDSALCAPATIRFTGVVARQDTAALQWRWNFGNGQQSNLQSPLPATYTRADSYTISAIATNGAGCADTSVKRVVIHPVPLVDAGKDATICKGATYQLQGANADTYLWSSPAQLSCTTCAAPVTTPDSTTVYKLQGQTIFGCKAEDSVIIEVKQPFKLRVSPADTLCAGSSLTLSASGAELYRWTPATGLDNPASARPKASPSQTTDYTVVGTDSKGCFADTAHVPLAVYPYPTVNAGEDKTILAGSSVTLTPKLSVDVTGIRWQPLTGLNCLDCPEPVAAPKQTTTYSISVYNQGGCLAKDEVTLFVVCKEGNLYMPNTFSPNGDGVNDVFYPRGRGIFGIRSFKIFNRWGEQVYEKYNFQANDGSPSAGWNGRYKDKDAGQDVYVYIIEVVCENSTVVTYKGNVALIR